MQKVVLSHRLHEAGMRVLQGKVEIRITNTGQPREMLPELMDADALILRIGSIDRETMAAAKNLRAIGRPGIGVDDVDVAAATERGIPVVIAPGANTRSVAEHALALILAASKDLLRSDRRTRAGDFGIRNAYKAFELRGKLLGVVGYGRIGQELAKLCSAIGMTVLVYDPFVQAETIERQGYRYETELEALLQRADAVSLHVPLTEETRNLIGEKELGMMKPSAVLINCARGGVVDEAALIRALQNGSIQGAGVDVFAAEPVQPGNPWVDLDNVIVTPHMAGLTQEAAAAVSTMAAEGVMAVLDGQRWPHVANPKAYDHPRWREG